MRVKIIAGVFFLSTLVPGCIRKDPNLGTSDPRVVGTWLLFERRVPQDSITLTRAIPSVPPQTITFTNEGTLQTTGEELEYYHSSKYYRLDTTLFGQLQVGFIINNLNPTFYQKVRLRADTLVLLPSCERECGLYFVRSR